MAEKKAKEENISLSDQFRKEHFKKVCPHGVPANYMCKSCNKIIEIPKDAVEKPEGYEEIKEVKEEK